MTVSPEDILISSDKVEHKTLAEALVAFQAEVGTVAKDADNPFFKSKYADLPAVKAAAQPILAKHGLAVTQKPSYVVVESKVHDTLITKVLHESGDSDWAEMILKPVKNDPQAQGSAITYARRYAFMSVLGLVADDDDDGNAASGKTRSTQTRSRAKASDPDDDANAEVRKAVAKVKAAAKNAGLTPAQATEYFAEANDGASLINSTDLKALKAAYDHFTSLKGEGDE